MNRKTLLLLLAISFSASAFAGNQATLEEPRFSDTLFYKKKAHRNIVRLSPNPTLNGTVSISSEADEGLLQVYVFDLSGTLIHQLTLKDREKYVLRNLRKGIYVYDVFKKDESIDGGRIIVK